jgi:ABC-type antimicrobial peptide transport system permease subunit
MKKKVATRCLIGALIGLAISNLIAIVISLIVGDGRFYAVVPELIADCGTEINAVLLQTICSLLYGAAWAGASIVWEVDNWSILRQTITHLIICSLCTFPIAYFMRWMNHSVFGTLSYFGSFFAIYFIIWMSQYIAIKKRIQQINNEVQKNNHMDK